MTPATARRLRPVEPRRRPAVPPPGGQVAVEQENGAASPQGGAASPLLASPRLSHRHALAEDAQRVWIGFGGRADRAWLRLLRPGFRHCFAAIEDAQGWTVVEPLSGRLLVSRPVLVPGFDLPGFYRRAGLVLVGPFAPGAPHAGLLPALSPYSCVAVCRAVLGQGAPFALTPLGLFRALREKAANMEKVLDERNLFP